MQMTDIEKLRKVALHLMEKHILHHPAMQNVERMIGEMQLDMAGVRQELIQLKDQLNKNNKKMPNGLHVYNA